MDKPSPPPAPDYVGAAQQQGQNNIDMAKMQNPNVVSPYGTQTVTYGGPPEQNQANFDPQAYLNANPDVAAAVARDGKGYFDTGRNQWIDPVGSAWEHYQNYGMKEGRQYTTKEGATGNIPTITQTLSPEQQKLFDQQNALKGLLGSLGTQGAKAMQGLIGSRLDLSKLPASPGNADATRAKVIQAMMSRVNEDTANQRDNLNSDLVAAGIRPGSKAYDDRMNLVSRQYNDARNQAYLASGQEASRDFAMDTQRRAQGLSEMMTERQMPLNEITALMSGSQVNNPFTVPGYSPMNPQGTPYMQALQGQSGYATDLYNAQAAQAGGINSGLFGIGSAGLMALGMMSDRRLKRNIQRVATHPLGIGVYEYDIFDRHERGVMADEVETVMPEAVLTHDSGYKMVRYDLIGGRP